jgi:RNA polymerase sigma-70 factor, ECF subfamily
MEAYRRYGRALLRKGQRLLGNRTDAEDAVQGLFADLLSRGAGEVDLPYLYRALTNRCLNTLRDTSNRQRLLAQHEDAVRGVVRTRCDDEVIGMDLLLKLLDRLDPKATEVLVYRYFDDLTQEEIAELLATSRKTVGKRLDKIREAVRALAGPTGA